MRASNAGRDPSKSIASSWTKRTPHKKHRSQSPPVTRSDSNSHTLYNTDVETAYSNHWKLQQQRRHLEEDARFPDISKHSDRHDAPRQKSQHNTTTWSPSKANRSRSGSGRLTDRESSVDTSSSRRRAWTVSNKAKVAKLSSKNLKKLPHGGQDVKKWTQEVVREPRVRQASGDDSEPETPTLQFPYAMPTTAGFERSRVSKGQTINVNVDDLLKRFGTKFALKHDTIEDQAPNQRRSSQLPVAQEGTRSRRPSNPRRSTFAADVPSATQHRERSSTLPHSVQKPIFTSFLEDESREHLPPKIYSAETDPWLYHARARRWTASDAVNNQGFQGIRSDDEPETPTPWNVGHQKSSIEESASDKLSASQKPSRNGWKKRKASPKKPKKLQKHKNAEKVIAVATKNAAITETTPNDDSTRSSPFPVYDSTYYSESPRPYKAYEAPRQKRSPFNFILDADDGESSDDDHSLHSPSIPPYPCYPKYKNPRATSRFAHIDGHVLDVTPNTVYPQHVPGFLEEGDSDELEGNEEDEEEDDDDDEDDEEEDEVAQHHIPTPPSNWHSMQDSRWRTQAYQRHHPVHQSRRDSSPTAASSSSFTAVSDIFYIDHDFDGSLIKTCYPHHNPNNNHHHHHHQTPAAGPTSTTLPPEPTKLSAATKRYSDALSTASSQAVIPRNMSLAKKQIEGPTQPALKRGVDDEGYSFELWDGVPVRVANWRRPTTTTMPGWFA